MFLGTLLTKHVHNYIENKGNAWYSTAYVSKYCKCYLSCWKYIMCTPHFNTCKVISVECYLLFPSVLSQSHSNVPCHPCSQPSRLDLYITHNQTSVYSGSRAEDQCSSHQRSYCPYVLWMVDTTEKRRVAYHHDISLYMCMLLTSFFQSHMNVDIQFFSKWQLLY